MSVERSTQQPKKAIRVADHLRELQKRFIASAIALVIAGIAVYFVYEPLLNVLRSPLDAPLYYSTPAGSFAFVMQICLMGALAVTIPILVYNLIMFVRPAFEKALPLRRVYLTTVISAFLAAAGAAFGFLVIIPGALSFFAGFQVDGLSALIAADSYLNFVTNVIVTFVLMFQLPLLIIFIDTIKPIAPKTLFGMEKWVILGSLVISFMVPFALDITTSLLIALPIIVLYNLSIAIVLLRHAHKRAKDRRALSGAPYFGPTPAARQFVLSDQLFDDILRDLADDDTSIVYSAPLPDRLIPARRIGSEISRVASRPAPVTPAEWVHRVAKPIPRNERARIISDITPRSHALS